MFCTYCKMARENNEAPCPNCGAPSPLLGQSNVGGWGTAGSATASWGNPISPPPNGWGNNQPLPFQAPGSAFPTASWQQPNGMQQPWGNQAPQPQQPWGNGALLQVHDQPQQYSPMAQDASAQQSLLPVPYQGDQQQQMRDNNGMQLIPMPDREQMLPAMPIENPDVVHVPPMYVKPRPIIPTYRIISGFLSFIIVTLLLCGAAGYYVKTSGQLAFLQRFYGDPQLPNIQPTATVVIPDPPKDNTVRGPAANIINSAALGSDFDPQYNSIKQFKNDFKVGSNFYITYNARADATGVITMKFYMDGYYYTEAKSEPIDPKKNPDGVKGHYMMSYSQPARGRVEIYWNDQKAWTLYFVVR